MEKDSGAALVIAEIGTSHGGDIRRAGELIAAAAEAGAGAAKFQFVIADEILHPGAGFVDLPGGKVPLYDVFRGLERPPEFYAELKALTEKRGMLFVCSSFGLQSARALRDIGTEVFKVASPELNHFPLLRKIASYKKPVILSSGVSTLGDIERALVCFRPGAAGRTGGRGSRKSREKAPGPGTFPPVSLLHCVTAYHAPEEEYNLRLLPNLAALFGIPVGISDHSLDPILVPVLSVLQGASLIEKHFTLERGGGGLDDPVALTPADFTRMVREVRAAETEMSAGRVSAVTEALDAVYGADRVERVLGDGIKRLAPSEAANYPTTNRSIHALRDILAGEVFTNKNTALLRSEKNLRPGLPPELWDHILGRRTGRDIPAGEGILWDDLFPARGKTKEGP